VQTLRNDEEPNNARLEPKKGPRAMADADRKDPVGPDEEKVPMERDEQIGLEFKRLELERYKARLDFWKFVSGSVIAAVVIAFIPPAFQLATAKLETARKDRELAQESARKDRELTQSKVTFHETYIKDFLEKALNQDIEIRIRLATYFADVSDDEYKKSWNEYLDKLSKLRDRLRGEINAQEKTISELQKDSPNNKMKIAELRRNLEWKYGELGYSPHDQDVSRARDISLEQDKLAVEAMRLDNYVQFLTLKKLLSEEKKVDLSRFDSIYERRNIDGKEASGLKPEPTGPKASPAKDNGQK
jgi:hypothetical protein